MHHVSSFLPALRCATLLASLAGAVQAAIIQPNTASASSEFSATYAAINTINGSGLNGAVGTLPTHAAYSSASGGNHWTTDNGTNPLNAYIVWGFTTPQTLDTIYLWNHQSTLSLAANSGYDVGNFDLTFFDATSAVLGTYSGTLAFDSNAAQAFNFGTIVGVSSVRFDVNSVQSSTTYTGLAEVAFNTTTPTNRVPDGGLTVACFALALFGLRLFSGRRAAP